MFVSQEPDDDRVWYVTLSDTPTSQDGLKQVAVDARTGRALAEPQLDAGFMHVTALAAQTCSPVSRASFSSG